MGRNLGLILITILLFTHFPSPWAQNCRPTGYFRASGPPPGKCRSVASGCCQADQVYFTFQCSPDVTSNTTATLAYDTFLGGGSAPKCGSGGKRDVGEEAVVALSTGWFDGGKRCGKVIVVSRNGRRVRATVVGECDSTAGCDAAHGFRAPCGYNVVVGSRAVWRALGLDGGSQAQFDVTWSDA